MMGFLEDQAKIREEEAKNREASKLMPEDRQGQTTEQEILPGVTLEEKDAEKVAKILEDRKAKGKPSEPWNPATLLDLEHKEKGYRYRWAHKGVVSKRLREGWEIVDGKSHSHGLPTVIDGKPLDSTIQMRDLIAMRIPEERAKARDEYYRKLNAIQAENKMKKPLEEATEGSAYGKVEITMGEEPE